MRLEWGVIEIFLISSKLDNNKAKRSFEKRLSGFIL